MILKKCVTLQFCAKLLCTELVETYKKVNWKIKFQSIHPKTGT
jgi:hypothetical protein